MRVTLGRTEQLPPLLADDPKAKRTDVFGCVAGPFGAVPQYVDRPPKQLLRVL